MIRTLFLCIALTGICLSGRAQHVDTSRQAVIDIVNQLHSSYSNNRILSFKVLYTYADADSSNKILDSIPAIMQTSNNKYRFNIGPTEIIANKKYSIMLFSEDKLMYITKPSTDTLQIDPMSKIDSSFFSISGLQTIVKAEKKIKAVEMLFPEGSLYKSIRLTIEKSTGFLLKTQFIVKPEAFNKTENPGMRDIKSDYALIEANYYDYNTMPVNDSVFMETKYFTRSGQNFTPTAEYKEYKIFVGSPNL